ncbi:conjugal transfer protein MobC [Roseivirga sp. BDSF3-8]|uniref:conjugal transfer protein MobC n=1 Tax=Roseivirga sp. BDSF3-8 TaxID=3241598 RepID=UPI00353240E1
MHTGENTEGLRKIIDWTRLISVSLLGLHIYYYGYGQFEAWGLTAEITDRLLINIANTGLFQHILYSKALALGVLIVSLIGAKGKKSESLTVASAIQFLIPGVLLFSLSHLVFYIRMESSSLFYLYSGVTISGYLLIMAGGTRLSRIVSRKLKGDIFNKQNQTFPQEERKLENEYSINLPARYSLKGKLHRSWVNIINPFRALLVMGTPGAGKSYFVIRHVITQHISKGFTMFVYDFKYDDLSRIAYNSLLQNAHRYPIKPAFYTINFDDLAHTHRCNPLEPATMLDITDATESSRTIMLGLNREWIRKQGDFFVESPINFVTAVIWFLKKYKNGKYCTLPHVIELMQIDYDKLFSVLRLEPEIEVLINPFVSAYLHGAAEQLEGQIASAKITMARLVSPQLYYVLSESEFTLDINDPEAPKIVCMGNNPQKQQVYGAVLSLFISRLTKLVNQKHRQKSSLIFDEFPTIYFNGIDSLIATARSNKVATTLGVQDYSQLKKDYGREQAEVVMNAVGNIISGQVSGDTARSLSERVGKIMQERESLSINSSDTSLSKSTQLDSAVPASAIASLSSGEFVGVVADDPQQKIALKAFHNEILNNHKAIAQEEAVYQDIPAVRAITHEQVEANYMRIKQDVKELIDREIERIMDSPGLSHLLIHPPGK